MCLGGEGRQSPKRVPFLLCWWRVEKPFISQNQKGSFSSLERWLPLGSLTPWALCGSCRLLGGLPALHLPLSVSCLLGTNCNSRHKVDFQSMNWRQINEIKETVLARINHSHCLCSGRPFSLSLYSYLFPSSSLPHLCTISWRVYEVMCSVLSHMSGFLSVLLVSYGKEWQLSSSVTRGRSPEWSQRWCPTIPSIRRIRKL